jgi:hypothetical protein
MLLWYEICRAVHLSSKPRYGGIDTHYSLQPAGCQMDSDDAAIHWPSIQRPSRQHGLFCVTHRDAQLTPDRIGLDLEVISRTLALRMIVEEGPLPIAAWAILPLPLKPCHGPRLAPSTKQLLSISLLSGHAWAIQDAGRWIRMASGPRYSSA